MQSARTDSVMPEGFRGKRRSLSRTQRSLGFVIEAAIGADDLAFQVADDGRVPGLRTFQNAQIVAKKRDNCLTD
jgi:hypothetical protein